LLAKQTSGFYWRGSTPAASTRSPLFQALNLNGDGKLDLLTAFYSTATPPVTTTKVYAGLGTGLFGAPQTILSQSAYTYPVAVPLIKGGKPAIILFPSTSSKTHSIEVLVNQSK